MTVNRGLFVRNNGTVGTTPIQGRLVLASLVAENAPGTPRNGLLDQKATTVVSGKPDMSYDVSAITAIVNRAASEGVYMFTTTGTTNVTTTAAPGTGSRYDLIYLLQRDLDKGDADNTAVLAVLQGTAATSPTKPYASLPAGAYVLAEALIASGATATNGAGVTITQVWRYTSLRGVPITVRNTTERDEITTPQLGMQVCRLDNSRRLDEWDGSVWNTAALLDALPKGLVYSNKVTTSTGQMGAGPTVVFNVASFTFQANRNYRIVWDTSHYMTDTASEFYMSINTCSTADAAAATTGLTALGGRTKGAYVGSSITQSHGPITAYYKPTSTTTVQLKFVTQRVVGSGNMVVVGNGTGEPVNYVIYDEGAAI